VENVLVPSFSPDLRCLDEAGIRLDVRQSIRHGFFSSLCALEAGLTPEEKGRMLAVATDEAAGRIGISVSLSEESLEADLALLKTAEGVGATHALLSFPQDFRPATQDEVYDFVAAIAASTSLGICLYASEKFSLQHLHPSGLPIEAFERLAELDNVVALKLGGMDAGLILECCERFCDRLLVTTVNLGMLPLLSQSFDVQWTGAWTAEALQSPQQPHVVRFVQLLRERRLTEAMQIYWSLAPALGAMLRVMGPLVPTGTYHWPMLKYQQWLSGGNGGMTRQPCMRMFARDMQMVRAGLRGVGIECADDDAHFYVGRSAFEVPGQ
jgi:4-hydroxy-tetrahydrodipicolinate synthase